MTAFYPQRVEKEREKIKRKKKENEKDMQRFFFIYTGTRGTCMVVFINQLGVGEGKKCVKNRWGWGLWPLCTSPKYAQKNAGMFTFWL